MKRKKTCGKCGINPRRPTHAYCFSCHAKGMREYRKKNPLTPNQRKKMICRSYTHVYIKRGKIIKLPCKVCGNKNSQVHHKDYNKPLLVTWLCRPCHLRLHSQERLSC